MLRGGTQNAQTSLDEMVSENSMLWGADVSYDYHQRAAQDMRTHWDLFIQPAIRKHPIDYARVIDFACGQGRNSDMLVHFADHITMIDVHSENVEFCLQKYSFSPRIDVKSCNGYNLDGIDDQSTTFLYCFDAMVHFPPEIVRSYMPEFQRVMCPGAYAFIHHSNYDKAPGGDFRSNPHWRNHMSAGEFAGIATAAGLEVVEQVLIDWEIPELDCISVLSRPAA